MLFTNPARKYNDLLLNRGKLIDSSDSEIVIRKDF